MQGGHIRIKWSPALEDGQSEKEDKHTDNFTKRGGNALKEEDGSFYESCYH